MNQNYDINKKAIEYNETISPQLNRILKPLFEHFGFTHFAHTKYFDGDRYLTLCADTEMGKGFFRSALDVYMFFERFNLPKHSKLKVIWDLQQDNNLLEHLRQHGYYHGITVFYRGENHVEGWNFAVDSGNSKINQLYTENSDLLEQCISYVQGASQGLLDHLPEEALAIYQDNRLLNIESMFEKPLAQDHQAFMDSIRRKYMFYKDGRQITLTPIEFDCLKALSSGMTSKVIARNRGISPRTVESCIDKIRDKFRVDSKIQLVDEYHKSIYSTK